MLCYSTAVTACLWCPSLVFLPWFSVAFLWFFISGFVCARFISLQRPKSLGTNMCVFNWHMSAHIHLWNARPLKHSSLPDVRSESWRNSSVNAGHGDAPLMGIVCEGWCWKSRDAGAADLQSNEFNKINQRELMFSLLGGHAQFFCDRSKFRWVEYKSESIRQSMKMTPRSTCTPCL